MLFASNELAATGNAMSIKQKYKKHTKRWWFSAAALCVALISVVAFIRLVQPVFSVPWRNYSVELLPGQAYQRNMLWQASQKQYPSLVAQLAALPLQANSAVTEQSLSIFQIAAGYEQHFCTGDKVLLIHGQQQSHGILRLRVASGDGKQRAQFGIELSEPLFPASLVTDTILMQLRRVSYQAGDWLKVSC